MCVCVRVHTLVCVCTVCLGVDACVHTCVCILPAFACELIHLHVPACAFKCHAGRLVYIAVH